MEQKPTTFKDAMRHFDTTYGPNGRDEPDCQVKCESAPPSSANGRCNKNMGLPNLPHMTIGKQPKARIAEVNFQMVDGRQSQLVYPCTTRGVLAAILNALGNNVPITDNSENPLLGEAIDILKRVHNRGILVYVESLIEAAEAKALAQSLYDTGHADGIISDAPFAEHIIDPNDSYRRGFYDGSAARAARREAERSAARVDEECRKQDMYNLGYNDGLVAHEVTPTPPDEPTDTYYDGLHEGIEAHRVLQKRNVAKHTIDMVNKPPHYMLPGLDIEVIDVRSSLLKTIPPGMPYEVVTSWSEAWTYLTRMWGKNGLEDLKKAQVYIARQIKIMEENNEI